MHRDIFDIFYILYIYILYLVITYGGKESKQLNHFPETNTTLLL